MSPPGTARHLGAALSAGLVCGGLWFLSATMILDVVRPGGVVVPALVLGAVAGLAAAAFFWRPGTARQIWGRAILTVGFHALALPDRRDQVPNARHAAPPRKVLAKLEIDIAEVKRYESLEVSLRTRYASRRSPL